MDSVRGPEQAHLEAERSSAAPQGDGLEILRAIDAGRRVVIARAAPARPLSWAWSTQVVLKPAGRDNDGRVRTLCKRTNGVNRNWLVWTNLTSQLSKEGPPRANGIGRFFSPFLIKLVNQEAKRAFCSPGTDVTHSSRSTRNCVGLLGFYVGILCASQEGCRGLSLFGWAFGIIAF